MGTHRDTGERLEGLEDVKQSIGEILRTPLRSRIMRPELGAELLGSVDLPMNPTGKAKVYGRTAGAVARWEPRARVRRSSIATSADGEVTIDVESEVDSEVINSSSGELGISEVRRLIHPSLYYDPASFDFDADEWRSRFGGRALTAIDPAAAIDTVTPPTAFGAEGFLFNGTHGLWLGPASADHPLAPDRAWTLAVGYRLRSDESFVSAWALGVLDEDDGYCPWIWQRWVAGNPVVRIDYPAVTVGHDIAHQEGQTFVSWVWHLPATPARPARAGIVGPTGAREINLAAMPAGAPVALAFGGSFSGLPGAENNGRFFGQFTGTIAHLGIWPRVLTRRERIGIEAHWRRELA